MFGLEFSDKEHHVISQMDTPTATSPPAAWEAYGLQQLTFQQEPVNRQEPVEKLQAPETARNMKYLFETGNLPDLHDVVRTVPDLTFDQQIPGSGVFENTPVRLEGVIREDESFEGEEVASGSTKSKLDNYLEKSNTEFVIKRRPVQVMEDEGRILENDPVQRDDVIRESDHYGFSNGLPGEGQAAILRHQWTNMRDEFIKDDKPIKLIEREDERGVFENQPETLQGVLREEDFMEDPGLRMGMTSDLKSYWTNYRDKEIYARDRPIDLPGPGAAMGVLENEPIRLEGVVREEDLTGEEIAAIEKGKARSLVNRWQSIDDGFQGKDAFDLQKELAAGKEAGVFENQPDVLREGVIKSGEVIQDVITLDGVTKFMSQRFRDSEFWNPKVQKAAPVMDLAEGPGVHENQPSILDPEVIRCDADSDETLYEMRRRQSGATASLVGKWVRNDLEGADLSMPDKSYFHNPKKLLEREKAQDAGVYENNPDVRRDVYREEDDQQDRIPQKTKSLKELWMRMGEEGPKKTGIPQQIRFTPPRERTPPEVNSGDPFTSSQQINLNHN